MAKLTVDIVPLTVDRATAPLRGLSRSAGGDFPRLCGNRPELTIGTIFGTPGTAAG